MTESKNIKELAEEFRKILDESNVLYSKLCAFILGVNIALTPEETEKIAKNANLEPIPDGCAWRPGLNLVDGMIITHKGKNYIVIEGKGHISQIGWEPDVVTNLFNEIKEDYAEWEQPFAHNAYMKGDKVSYNGKKYISNIDNNVYAPGIVPGQWSEI